jgi:hypothetical protein
MKRGERTRNIRREFLRDLEMSAEELHERARKRDPTLRFKTTQTIRMTVELAREMGHWKE